MRLLAGDALAAKRWGGGKIDPVTGSAAARFRPLGRRGKSIPSRFLTPVFFALEKEIGSENRSRPGFVVGRVSENRSRPGFFSVRDWGGDEGNWKWEVDGWVIGRGFVGFFVG